MTEATQSASSTALVGQRASTLRAGGRPRWQLMLVGAVVLAVGGSAALVWERVHTGSSVGYVTSAASIGAVTRIVSTTGTVNPELTIIVGSYVSGVIKDMYCDYNTEVKTGQVCAKIDPRPYQTAVDQARANLAVGKAQLRKDEAALAYAKVNNERNATLVKSNAVSLDAADNARSVYEQAQAQVVYDQGTIEPRQASGGAAQVNLDYTDIVSPVDGTVVSRNITIGQTVAASFQTPTLFLIATDLTQMQGDNHDSESEIGGIGDGDKAFFTVDAFPKRTFDGTVTQVRQSPQTVQNVVTFDVVVSVDNNDLALKPGMTAATRIIVDQRNDVLRVPSQTLRYSPAAPRSNSDNQTQVWVLRDGKPMAVPVTIGLDDEIFTEIVKGDLHPGDQIIVSEQRDGGKMVLPTPRL